MSIFNSLEVVLVNDSTEMYVPMTVALKFRATGYYANGHWWEIIEIGKEPERGPCGIDSHPQDHRSIVLKLAPWLREVYHRYFMIYLSKSKDFPEKLCKFKGLASASPYDHPILKVEYNANLTNDEGFQPTLNALMKSHQ